MGRLRTIRTLLIVDDKEDVLRGAVIAFQRAGKRVLTASTAAGGSALARQERPDFVLVDRWLPDGSGLDLIRDLLADTPGLEIALFSGAISARAAAKAMRLGAIDVFVKPLRHAALLREIEDGESELDTSTYDYPTLAQVEWDHVMRALEDCAGNITKAARLLGIERSALQARLRKNPPAGRQRDLIPEEP